MRYGTASKSTLQWDPVPGASSYSVVRGDLAALPVGPGSADEVCWGYNSTTTITDTAIPVGGYFYLVRGNTGFCKGTLGTGRQNVPAPPTFPVRTTTSCP